MASAVTGVWGHPPVGQGKAPGQGVRGEAPEAESFKVGGSSCKDVVYTFIILI